MSLSLTCKAGSHWGTTGAQRAELTCFGGRKRGDHSGRTEGVLLWRKDVLDAIQPRAALGTGRVEAVLHQPWRSVCL